MDGERNCKKIYIRRNIIAIATALIVDFLSILIAAFLWNYKNSAIIVSCLSGIIIVSCVLFVITIIRIIKICQIFAEQEPYNYQYYMEYEIHKRVGKGRKDYTAKKIIDAKVKIPRKYTEWKKDIVSRNTQMQNNEDFYHFLIYFLRRANDYYESITTILTPLEIGFMTVFLTVYVTKGGSAWSAIFTAAVVLLMLTRELYKCKNEIAYIEDVIEVLCPDCKEGKN